MCWSSGGRLEKVCCSSGGRLLTLTRSGAPAAVVRLRLAGRGRDEDAGLQRLATLGHGLRGASDRRLGTRQRQDHRANPAAGPPVSGRLAGQI